MGKMLLIRHGESLANRAGIYQGQSVDTSLSLLGRRQASLLVDRLKSEKVGYLLTSPLKRTSETARFILKNNNTRFIEDLRLLEINHGSWEGLHKEAVMKRWTGLTKTWKTAPHKAQMPNGENLQAVARRVNHFVRDLEKNYHNKTVAIVSHDVILRVLICKALGLPLSRLWAFELDNCSLSVITFDRSLRVLTLNETAHLKQFRSCVDGQAR